MKINVWTLTLEDDTDKVNGPIQTFVRATELECLLAMRDHAINEWGVDYYSAGPIEDEELYWADEAGQQALLGSAESQGAAFWIDSHPVDIGLKLEILHVRDPDGECSVDLWRNGDLTLNFVLESIDAGRGWTVDDWHERIREVQEQSPGYSPAFRTTVLSALADPPGHDHIT